MDYKERRGVNRKEQTNGRTDFPESLASPRDCDNQMARYSVFWHRSNGKITGNCYADRSKAESVRDKMIDAGTFAGTRTIYCAFML